MSNGYTEEWLRDYQAKHRGFEGGGMTSINKFIEKRQMLERVRLVGPQHKSREVMKALASKGYRLIQSGPYTTKTMFPKVDPDRFLFIAERDI